MRTIALALCLATLAIPCFADGPTPDTPATTQPDLQSLKANVDTAHAALLQAQAAAVAKLADNPDWQQANADYAAAGQALDAAGDDANARSKAAADRLDAGTRIDKIKSAAWAADPNVQTAQKANQEALKVLNAAVAAAPPARQANSVNPVVDEMMARGQVEWQTQYDGTKQSLEQMERTLSLPDSQATKAARDMVRAGIPGMREALSKLEKSKANYLPSMGFKIGSSGRFPSGFTILQIVDENNMLVDFTNGNGDTFTIWVKGIKTAGSVDHQAFSPENAMYITGTTQYANAGGSTSTVFVAEPVDYTPAK